MRVGGSPKTRSRLFRSGTARRTRRPTQISNASPALWHIVKVPFPYTNRPVEQFRPALVIANYAHSNTPTLLWVLMITSAAHRRWPDDIEITDFAAGGLSSPSIVRIAKIATVEARDTQVIGRLPNAQQPAILALFAVWLAAMTAAGPAGS